MPNLDPWKNKYENDLSRTTEEQEKKANSKFENYLLSYRDECQKTIDRNSHQHPTYLERYQKIIEMIVGYVANDEINKGNNGNKDKTSMIELSRSD